MKKPQKSRRSKSPTLRRWQRDPVAFIREVLRDPETGAPFTLYPEEIGFSAPRVHAAPRRFAPFR